MLIALDYDHTYTADPDLWLKFIADAHDRGHKVILATMRSSAKMANLVDLDPRLLRVVDGTYYTNLKAKIPYLASQGVHPDIYIDDHPQLLLEDAN